MDLYFTAYGQQTALFTPLIRDLGHDVVISAFHGLSGGTLNWQGITVLPGSAMGDDYGTYLLTEHMRDLAADVAITLTDIWVFDPSRFKDLPVAHWMPVDTTPLSCMDKMCLQISGATPIALSRFGENELRQAGFDPLYVPHGIHPAFFGELPGRDAARAEHAIGDRFAIGLNAANKDAFRKGMGEQFYAFAQLHAKHPDTVLLVHGLPHEKGAIDLMSLAKSLQIEDAVQYPEPYLYKTGQIDVSYLLSWYRALDLYSGCACAEGFGLPIVEAQACGVPVVVSDVSAMKELCGAGWRVKVEPFWNPAHNAWWGKPLTGEICKVYERAYQRGRAYQAQRAKAREFAQTYEPERVLHEYWKPALEGIEAGL
jgi:glycosyltransferase involved in cell wall biosynthesis